MSESGHIDCPAPKLRMSYPTILLMCGLARVDNMSLYYRDILSWVPQERFSFCVRFCSKRVALCVGALPNAVCESFALWAKASGCRELLVKFVIPTDCPAWLTCRPPTICLLMSLSRKPYLPYSWQSHMWGLYSANWVHVCLRSGLIYCGVQRWLRCKMYCRLTLRSVKRPKKGLKWFCSRKH